MNSLPAYLSALPPGVRRLTAGWLLLSIICLLLSASFALLLLAQRTPGLSELFTTHDFFFTSLVLHVNLAMLGWFLCFAGALWSFCGDDRWMPVGWSALTLAGSGAITMVVSAFAPETLPVMSNYIPVLDTPEFLVGLFLFGCGLTALLLRTLLTLRMPSGRNTGFSIWLALYSAAVTFLIALLILLWSAFEISTTAAFPAMYDSLFWGAGHVFQFGHSLLLVASWLWISRLRGIESSPLTIALILAIVAVALGALPIQWIYDAGQPAYRRAFTNLMIYGAWFALVPVTLLLIVQNLRSRAREPGSMLLALSLFLFLGGAVTGSMIRGDNVLVPAHYHGVIGAVSLAYMGLCPQLLTGLGVRSSEHAGSKWPEMCYGGGTFILMIALAWSGLQGVVRKTPGIDTFAQDPAAVMAMLLMGLGGSVAVCGVLTFTLPVLRTLCSTRLFTAPENDTTVETLPHASCSPTSQF